MAALSLIILVFIATSTASVSAQGSSNSNRGGVFNPFEFVASFPWSNFPSFTNFDENIKNRKPGPGETFTGAAVSTNDGGSKIVTNLNGVVKEFKTGDNPPQGVFMDDDKPFKFTPIEPIKFDAIKFEPMEPMEPMEPIKFDPIDPEELKNYKPKPNEHFVGKVSKMSSHSSNVNGKVKNGGYHFTLVNDNGKVLEDKQVFGDGDDISRSEHVPPFEPQKFSPIEPIKFDAIKFKPMEPMEPMEHMKPIKFDPIDPEEVKNYKPKPNEHFVGKVSKMSSHSSNVNGKVKNGGYHFTLVNDNGKVLEDKQVFGDGDDVSRSEHVPPFVPHKFKKIKPIKFPKIEPVKFPEFEPIEFPKFEPIKFPKFEPIKFPKFEPIKIDPIVWSDFDAPSEDEIKDYRPKQNERFHGSVVKEAKHYSNVNGKVNGGGYRKMVVNDNGQVRVNKEVYGNPDEGFEGDSEGETNRVEKPRKFKKYRPPEFPKHKHRKIPAVFDPFKDTDDLVSYKPNNHHSYSKAFKLSSHSSNVNGKIKKGGFISTFIDDNGQIHHYEQRFGDGGDEKSDN